MERIQPPPNYYGAPYPQTVDNMSPYPPQMNGYPPANPIPYRDASVPADTSNDSDFYETFNKLVATNIGKNVNVHCSFTDSTKWHDVEFIGVLASAGDNYIIVYDPKTGHHNLIVGVYIDYIEFFDKVVMDGVSSK